MAVLLRLVADELVTAGDVSRIVRVADYGGSTPGKVPSIADAIILSCCAAKFKFSLRGVPN